MLSRPGRRSTDLLVDLFPLALVERRFPGGYTVAREGQPVAGFWVVTAGSADLTTIAADGRVQIFETCGEGDAFGLAAALEGGPASESAVTREPSRLAFVPREDLLAAMRARPEVAIAVAREIAAHLRRRTERLASGMRGVRQRVAAFVLDEAERRGVRRPDGAIEVAIVARREEIAARLGTVREVLARALGALEREGLIERARGALRVLDVERLRGVCER
jgi:CRP-like cAMP-binding protein